jgi:hypothetical protein
VVEGAQRRKDGEEGCPGDDPKEDRAHRLVNGSRSYADTAQSAGSRTQTEWAPCAQGLKSNQP